MAYVWVWFCNHFAILLFSPIYPSLYPIIKHYFSLVHFTVSCRHQYVLKWHSNFLNLPRLDLWPRMWSILEKVPCALEKKVKLIVLEWNVLQISIRSSWSIVSFKVCVSLLIFFLVDQSIVVSGLIKSPTIIMLLLISSFILLSIWMD